jgi:hypothetical protein
MNVEIGNEAAQLILWERINQIFFAVHSLDVPQLAVFKGTWQ